jgi:hypothetical protein
VKTVAQLHDSLAQTDTKVIIVNTNRRQNVADHDAVYAAVAKALRAE